jgi:hypothetical protein
MSVGTLKAFLILLWIGLLGISIKLALEPGAALHSLNLTAEFEHRSDECLESNPSWSRDVCERIARGGIWIGMTKEMTLASRGEPKSVERPDGEDPTREEWTYHSARHGLQLLHFEDGILTGWENPDPGCSTCG